MKHNEFMTAREVADDFFEGKLSYQKVLRLTRKKILPSTKLGNEYLYKRTALEAWANRHFKEPSTRLRQ